MTELEQDLTALRAEAMRKALWEADCCADFRRQCVGLWVDGLDAEELADYVNPD